MLGRHHYARRQPLQVPLPGPRQRLVEVVDVENDVALGCRESAEVHQMRVPARLHLDSRHRCFGEVGRHQRRRASVEREGRRGHPSHPQRDQLRDSVGVGVEHDSDRVASILRRRPSNVRVARHAIAQRLPHGTAFVARGFPRQRFQRFFGGCSFHVFGHYLLVTGAEK